MEEKSQNASESASTPKTSESSGQATVTISVEAFRMLIQSMKPDADADLLMAKMGIVPTPPTVDMGIGEAVKGGTEGPTIQQEVLEVVREEPSGSAEVLREVRTESALIRTTTVDESMLEAEQPLHTPEEVVANLAAGDAEITEETMETGVENPTERVNEATEGTTGERKVLTTNNEEGRIKRTTPRNEAARARAATMHIYQRRPARAETSKEKSTEEQQRGTPGKEAEGGGERPERSTVEPPRRRRRLLLDEEPDEAEQEVVFTLIETLPSSGHPASPAEKKDIEREQRERKRKGKAVATPAKKKQRQASSTLVIHEERQRVEEDDDEEKKALRRERRSKRRNDGAREVYEHRPERARVQFKKMQVDLTNDLLGRMITFADPKLTKECEARVGRGKKVR